MCGARSHAAPLGQPARFVFKCNTSFEQLRPDPVCFGIIFRLLGGDACRDPCFDRGGIECAPVRATRGLLQKDAWLAAEETQQTSERPQLPCEHCVARAVDFARQFEQHRHRHWRIEVVVHRGLETLRVRFVPVECRIIRRHVLQCGVKTRERTARVVDVRIAVVQRRTVVRARDEKAYDFGIVSRKHFADREEVAERLRHLLIVDLHVAIVHPVIDKRLP